MIPQWKESIIKHKIDSKYSYMKVTCAMEVWNPTPALTYCSPNQAYQTLYENFSALAANHLYHDQQQDPCLLVDEVDLGLLQAQKELLQVSVLHRVLHTAQYRKEKNDNKVNKGDKEIQVLCLQYW